MEQKHFFCAAPNVNFWEKLVKNFFSRRGTVILLTQMIRILQCYLAVDLSVKSSEIYFSSTALMEVPNTMHTFVLRVFLNLKLYTLFSHRKITVITS